MSRIWVDRIEALAKRRIARTAQVEALPPQPARHRGEHWDFNRQPFVHARMPGLMSRSIGKNDPIKAALADSPRLQQYISETFNNYDLQELMVSPVLPAEVYDAIAFNVATYDPSTPDAALMALYEPAGYNIDSVAQISAVTNFPAGPYKQKFTGPAIPAPCILKEFAWGSGENVYSFVATGLPLMSMYIEGFDVLQTIATGTGNAHAAAGTSSKGINKWVVAGALIPTIEIDYSADVTDFAIHISPYIRIIAEPLIKKR